MALLLAVAAGDQMAAAQQDPVSQRQALMRANGAALRQIDGIIRAGADPAGALTPAQRIAGIAAQIATLFPPGTDSQSQPGVSGAKPAIWQSFDDFQARAAALQDQAGLLAAAAQSGDPAILRAQFDKVAAACGDCHHAYRQRRN
jgi:cytochrome c556